MTTYTIRPLEWTDGHEASSAATIIGGLLVYKVWGKWVWHAKGELDRPCKSLADGKAAAEAWYKQRLIGGALDRRGE